MNNMKAGAPAMINPEVEEQILAGVDGIADELIEAIRDIVRIKSVQEDPQPGAPFGPGVRQALDATLERCRNLGFETVDCDGYLGYASWGAGAGDGYACAMGHLDVVPEGTGWKEPPYSGFMADGTIYSRGVLDNKGPIYSCLYAAKVLKDLGLEPARELRIMFGCNEETGFGDLEYYLAHFEPPVTGFTPDCKYPVVYAERGRAQVRMVPVASGECTAESLLEHFFAFVNTYILNAKPNGERLGIDCVDEEFGALEVRNYRLDLADGVPAVEFAISYPASATCDGLMARLRDVAAREGFEVTLVKNFNPVRFERDCDLCRCLQYAYERVTGADGTPVTTTGGTYAKMMPNIVPFGPSFPGQKGIGHQPNEWMRVDDIIANAKIYALALYLLTR